MDFVHLPATCGVSLALGLPSLASSGSGAESSIAGIRTFPLISVFGTVCAQIGCVAGGWIVAAGLVSPAATLVFTNFVKMKEVATRTRVSPRRLRRCCSSGSARSSCYGTMQAAGGHGRSDGGAACT